MATPPSLGSFKLEIKKGNKTITEVIFSRIVLILFCQVSPLPLQNPGSTPVVILEFHCIIPSVASNTLPHQ